MSTFHKQSFHNLRVSPSLSTTLTVIHNKQSVLICFGTFKFTIVNVLKYLLLSSEQLLNIDFFEFVVNICLRQELLVELVQLFIRTYDNVITYLLAVVEMFYYVSSKI